MPRSPALREHDDVSVAQPRPVAEIVALHEDAPGHCVRSAWPLHGFASRVLVGSHPSCDWVLSGDGVLARQCLLRWDGQHLVARLWGADEVSDVALPPGDALRVGAVELRLSPVGDVPTWPWSEGQPRSRVDALGPTVPLGLAPPMQERRSIVTLPATVPLRSWRRPRPSPRAASTVSSALRMRLPLLWRLLERLARGVLLLPLLPFCSDAPRALAAPLPPLPPLAAVIVAPPPPRPIVAPPLVEPLAPAPVAPKLAPLVRPPPSCDARKVSPAGDADYAALRLAMAAYRLGRRDEARVQFQMLTCRPEVGPLAQFMLSRLGSGKLRSPQDPANTALWLPQGDRAFRRERLFEEAAREIREHGDDWSEGRALDHIVLANPLLRSPTYDQLPKCNIFVGELLYRAGFVSPATPIGNQTVAYPSVNEMVAQADRLARGLPWRDDDGRQWFDLVPREAASPGDLIMIDAAHRVDVEGVHGHVELVRRVTHAHGVAVIASTVGARTRGAQVSTPPGAMFTHRDRAGMVVLSRFVLIARPRLR